MRRQSIEFHENGKRHKSSVASRLVDIKKKSAIERKEEQKMEMDMKRMEQVSIITLQYLLLLYIILHYTCIVTVQHTFFFGYQNV